MCPSSDSKQCSFVLYTDYHLPLPLTQQKQRKNFEKLQREREYLAMLIIPTSKMVAKREKQERIFLGDPLSISYNNVM